MTPKSSEVYTTNNWRFLAQARVEGQWFERKAHPIDRQPTQIREFCRERIPGCLCSFANSNPDVGGLIVIGIADNGEVLGIDRHGSEYTNRIFEYPGFLDGPLPEHKLVECERSSDGAPDHLIFI